eukprot:m.136453 g.136453  ORF g.136453 m.136453 type:complete len:315 (-) comp10674_c0_seq1:426-1370(-)
MSYVGPIIDTHQHFWDLDKYQEEYKWINDIEEGSKMSVLKNSYLIAAYAEDIKDCNVVKSVHVEAEYEGDDPVEETRFLVDLAVDEENKGGFPHAIVALVDMSGTDQQAIEDIILSHKSTSDKVCGVRQLLNWHDTNADLRVAKTNLLCDTTFRENIGLLEKHSLLFEFHIYEHQMEDARSLCEKYKSINFVLDHVGCPIDHSEEGVAVWLESIKVLATVPNIYCKISGLIHPMHTSKDTWSANTLEKWIRGCVESFGVERCIFGSNFPVDRVCGSYADIVQAVKIIFDKLSLTQEQQKCIFHDNAAALYTIKL